MATLSHIKHVAIVMLYKWGFTAEMPQTRIASLHRLRQHTQISQYINLQNWVVRCDPGQVLWPEHHSPRRKASPILEMAMFQPPFLTN